MISLLRKMFEKFLEKRNKTLVLRKAIFNGRSQILYGAHINLMVGSIPSDIVVGDNFRFFGGYIISQSNGKVKIGNNVKLGFDIKIGSVNSVTIGDGTSIADNVTIMDNNNHSVNPLDRAIMYQTDWNSEYRRWKYSDSSPIVIGKNVWIGSNVRICKGVTIGDGAVIAACSVVTKDVPSNSVAAGNPAKIVKTEIDKLPRLIPDDVLCK